MRVLCVAGARPNFVKVKPVLDALDDGGHDAIFVHTGQHYDDALDRAMFDDLALRDPDHALGVGSGSHAEQVARVMLALDPIVTASRPDIVLVVGDVNSTMAAALVGAKSPALVAHVEAGLRSGDWSMPEEVNRVVTDRVSDILLAPSLDAVDNLLVEGIAAERVDFVGNVMVDSLLQALPAAEARPVLDRLGLVSGRYVLATLHRPGAVDDDDVLAGIVRGLGRIARTLPVVLPAHPRAAARLAALPHEGVTVIPALGYLDFLALERAAAVVVTDSGGVQEETTVLGVPCVTVRTTTERPVTVTSGTNRVVGLEPDAIVAGFEAALGAPAPANAPPRWDGHAAQRIVEVLIRSLDAR